MPDTDRQVFTIVHAHGRRVGFSGAQQVADFVAVGTERLSFAPASRPLTQPRVSQMIRSRSSVTFLFPHSSKISTVRRYQGGPMYENF